MPTGAQIQAAAHDALAHYRRVANSHAVDARRKDRMLHLCNMVESLARTPGMLERAPVKAKLDELLEDLIALSPVPSRDGMTQIQNQEDVRPRAGYWELTRQNGLMHARDPGTGNTRIADGGYVFAVLASKPWVVRLGERINGGHTAVTRGADVYFAGEAFFQNGLLIRWNNDSGHYRPLSTLHTQVSMLLALGTYRERSTA